MVGNFCRHPSKGLDPGSLTPSGVKRKELISGDREPAYRSTSTRKALAYP
jgi:hypothetical protein